MNVADLREILQYVPKFWERTFIVAFDGEVVASENFPNLLLDLAVLRSLSIRVVFVHGASYQTRTLAAQRGVTLTNSNGLGVTDESSLRVSIDAAIRLTNEIMEGLSSVDLRAAYLNAIVAHPAGILGGVDQGFTGRVERVDARGLGLLVNEEVIPVIPPLGFDGERHTYRVNSDSIAVEVGIALQAAKIIFLTAPSDLKGIGLPQQMSIAEAEELWGKKKIRPSDSLASKLLCAAQACRQGVPRVHILDGTVNEALLTEIFSSEGFGTMVYSNEYQQIRRALKKDVRGILTLIRQSVEDEALVNRTRNEIIEHLEDYWILEVDKNFIACVALHPYPEFGIGELACLYVSKSHENQGYGRKLMSFIEQEARRRGFNRIFALSTQAFHYLQQKGGFELSDPAILPPERLKKYSASRRNSRVLVKNL